MVVALNAVSMCSFAAATLVNAASTYTPSREGLL